MFKYILVLVLSTLSSCVSGDKLDSKLKYLNGGSYKNKKVILAVPVLETKDQEIREKNK